MLIASLEPRSDEAASLLMHWCDRHCTLSRRLVPLSMCMGLVECTITHALPPGGCNVIPITQILVESVVFSIANIGVHQESSPSGSPCHESGLVGVRYAARPLLMISASTSLFIRCFISAESGSCHPCGSRLYKICHSTWNDGRRGRLAHPTATTIYT